MTNNKNRPDSENQENDKESMLVYLSNKFGHHCFVDYDNPDYESFETVTYGVYYTVPADGIDDEVGEVTEFTGYVETVNGEIVRQESL